MAKKVLQETRWSGRHGSQTGEGRHVGKRKMKKMGRAKKARPGKIRPPETYETFSTVVFMYLSRGVPPICSV